MITIRDAWAIAIFEALSRRREEPGYTDESAIGYAYHLTECAMAARGAAPHPTDARKVLDCEGCKHKGNCGDTAVADHCFTCVRVLLIRGEVQDNYAPLAASEPKGDEG